ncbi:MAG: sigma-70 family RNA polymerase sigma factor [Oscillospiraceae bacterium]|nr:sigma-70 family RNA polymerase sigma factor [Oscillospiraceae bacterium]
MFSLAFLLIRDAADRDFVKDLFKNNEQMMYKIAFNILHNRTDAEDTVQNTIIKVIDSLEKIRTLDSTEIEYYLSVMTKNTALDMQRKTKRLPESNVMEELDEMESDISVEEAALMNINSERIKEALRRLPEQEYEILFLNLQVGLSPSEIADQLGITSNTARQRIFRAKNNLKKELEKEGITNDV